VTTVDRFGRALGSLRVSVTDRCNLRCAYCMPEAEYVWLARDDLLSFDEIAALVDAFTSVGVARVRLTGGEPLLRPDVEALVALLAKKPAVRDLSLTTNGVMLADRARGLFQAGLGRLTVSLDTLRPDRFAKLTGREAHGAVMNGLRAAAGTGRPVKIDTVVLRGDNDDELADLLAFGRELGAEVRFIEYMDVGGATRWSPGLVVSRAEILASIARMLGAVEPLDGRGSAPAERFRLADGTTFGVIASTTAPFCRACDRGRLTADGVFYPCLYAHAGKDLRAALRSGASREELVALIARDWAARDDRGAETRLDATHRGPIIPVEALRRDPHLEMHTRGG
jgi:cyclic pyranopterin phosphate synthase